MPKAMTENASWLVDSVKNERRLRKTRELAEILRTCVLMPPVKEKRTCRDIADTCLDAELTDTRHVCPRSCSFVSSLNNESTLSLHFRCLCQCWNKQHNRCAGSLFLLRSRTICQR